MISHADQHRLWNAEHARPRSLMPMDSEEPSQAILSFLTLLRENGGDVSRLHGIEMGCGKGRNAIWLAERGMMMTAFDFSDVAIAEAKRRASKANVADRCNFLVADATMPWPFPDKTFDVGIDCYASTDIETLDGRLIARQEFVRVLKENGRLCVCAMADSSPYHRRLVDLRPAFEKGAFLRADGKFEKTFTRGELERYYQNEFTTEHMQMLTTQKSIEYGGSAERCDNWWMVLRKH